MEVRLPAAAIIEKTVAILPLDDFRVEDLGVLVSPGIYEVTEGGIIKIRVMDLGTRKVDITVLSPLARFIVDPQLGDMDLEFSVDEIFDMITVDRTRSTAELDYLNS